MGERLSFLRSGKPPLHSVGCSASDPERSAEQAGSISYLSALGAVRKESFGSHALTKDVFTFVV